MATEKLGFQELSATQANKFLTVNANLRQTEVFLTGVLDRDAGAVPGAPTNGDAYIVDVTTGAWTGFTLGDVAHYYGGTWYNYVPSEGARLWVADEDATLAWDGTAWINEASSSIGVASMTDNSVPYVASGVLAEDLDFTFDSASNTLAVPNIDVSTLITAGTYAAFGDEDTGFLFPAVNTIAMYTGGSERARINSGGAFLIGTTTGTDRLVVNPSGGSSAGSIAFKVGTTNADSIRLEAGGTVNTWLEYRGHLGHQWIVDSTEAARIDSSGNLLVGTTSSSGRLCVQNSNISNELVFTGTEYTNIYSETLSGFDIGTNSTSGASYLRFLTENIERMRIDSSGNVLVGTTDNNLTDNTTGVGTVCASPGTINNNFQIARQSPAPALYINKTGTVYGDCIDLLSNGTSVGTIGMDSSSNMELDATNTLLFKIAGTEKARIDGSGNLLVNTTTQSSTEKLGVVNTGSNYVAFFKGGDSSQYNTGIHNPATTGDNLFMVFGTEASLTVRGSIDYNRGGGLVRYNTTSDATLKTVVADVNPSESLEIIKKSAKTIKNYYWNHDLEKRTQTGPIAQELYKVFPEAVSEGGKTKDGYKPWMVDKTAHVWHLVTVCAKQQELIEELTKRVNKLEGN